MKQLRAVEVLFNSTAGVNTGEVAVEVGALEEHLSAKVAPQMLRELALLPQVRPQRMPILKRLATLRTRRFSCKYLQLTLVFGISH